ncbi:MAG: GNAT family N-acetyltransferase, partial [Candidatus Thermoplasmatota archaeon]|nr:GNAT family N-acetyltransferase [Candidatus Thermoplasmatota archaeon]
KGLVKNGNHIIILNDGKVDLDIRILNRKDLDIPYMEFLEILDTWLIMFTDPLEEMQDAVDDAFKDGYVLVAYRGDTMVGITILSTSRYDTFFPNYHLSYIATKKDIKGMGIATQLMQKAIEVTNGEFTLHVETDNKRAIKLYEKMGLRKKYYRMFYKGGVHGDEKQADQ